MWFSVFFFGSILLLDSEAFRITPNTNELLVKTEYGLIQGTKNTTVDLGKTYYAFRGIPYALPPLGELRFKPPVPIPPWEDILDATQDKSLCVQGIIPVEGEEDCLYLNIYIPKLRSPKSEKLPVMVWIHGGGFFSGGSQYSNYGPDYFLEQDVIVVTLNYRIGIFGFLSTNDMVAPGNFGLKDQNLALKWVKNNIEHFGGNQNNITIFGESAGAASVSLHLQSEKSKGLFDRAIMQSGTSLCLWSLSRLAKEAAFQTGKNLKLNVTNSETLVADLLNVDYRILQLMSMITFAAVILDHNPRNGLIFVPVIEPEHDAAFFTSKSHELLSKGDFQRVPSIIGYNSLEANIGLAWPIMLYLGRYDLVVSDLVSVDMNIENTSLLIQLGFEIKNYYFGFFPIALSLPNTVQFISDDQFNRPIHETLRLHSIYAPTYCYRFSYQGILGGAGNKTMEGIQHAEELGYFWRFKYANNSASESDQLTRARSIKLWTNFAKYGNPTPEQDPLLNDVKWPVYKTNPDGTDVSCLDIGTELEVVLNPNQKNLEFYRNLYNTYGVPPYDTY